MGKIKNLIFCFLLNFKRSQFQRSKLIIFQSLSCPSLNTTSVFNFKQFIMHNITIIFINLSIFCKLWQYFKILHIHKTKSKMTQTKFVIVQNCFDDLLTIFRHLSKTGQYILTGLYINYQLGASKNLVP